MEACITKVMVNYPASIIQVFDILSLTCLGFHVSLVKAQWHEFVAQTADIIVSGQFSMSLTVLGL